MSTTLRLMSFNIHKCVGGLDRRYDSLRTARVIAECDPAIVLLQEVAQEGSWYRNEKQVDVLGEKLGYPHRAYFVNVRFGPRRGAYGNAILSKHPIVEAANIDLTLPNRKCRSVLHAELRVPIDAKSSRTLHVFNLHLGLSERERRMQLRRFLDYLPTARIRARSAIVVAGDFNDVWGSLGTTLLEPAGFRGPKRQARTFPACAPMRALDVLLVRGGIHITSLKAIQNKLTRQASDHLPLIAELELRP
jgi:endonuclease/exonuclease/phosphatase family metal-dependent hydrolase